MVSKPPSQVEEEEEGARRRIRGGRRRFCGSRSPKFRATQQQQTSISGPGTHAPGSRVQSERVIWVRFVLRLLPRVPRHGAQTSGGRRNCSEDNFELPTTPQPLGQGPPLPPESLPGLARPGHVQGNTFLFIVQCFAYLIICNVVKRDQQAGSVL